MQCGVNVARHQSLRTVIRVSQEGESYLSSLSIWLASVHEHDEKSGPLNRTMTDVLAPQKLARRSG
jgi:hypothetical protein